MISYTPSESQGNTNASTGWCVISSSVVVPHAACCSNDKLFNCQEECNNPEETEEINPEDVVDVILVGDFGNEWTFLELWSTDAHQVSCAHDPDGSDWSQKDISQRWQQDDSVVWTQILAWAMKDSSTKSNVVPLAANKACIKESDNPNDNSSNLTVLVVVDDSFDWSILILHHEHISTAKDTKQEDGKHGDVKYWFGNESEKINVSDGDNENNCKHDK